MTSDLVDELVDAYRAAADPRRAAAMAAYMKNRFVFFGIPSPARRAIDRTVRRPGFTTAEDLVTLARACWAVDEREPQYFACDELNRHSRHLAAASLPLLEELIVTRSWWDTVDALAHTVGAIVRRDPSQRVVMDRWLAGDNLWLIRVALIHQLGWKDDTDQQWLFEACVARAGHPDFFIRKAIGWALREYSKTEGEAVRRFVLAHESDLSGLSRREALKRLAKVQDSARGR